jgi:hypothetical protein
MSPTDVTITRNYIYKPLSWCTGCGSYDGIQRSVKNSLELKDSTRVLASGNVIRNNWAGSQVGYTFLITPRNQSGSCPWARVADITFQNNKFINIGSGIDIMGKDSEAGPSQLTNRVLISNNLMSPVNGLNGAGANAFLMLISPEGAPTNLSVIHNTTIQFNDGATCVSTAAGTSCGLQVTSPGHNAGTDGADIGVNITTLNTAISGVEVGP